MLKISLTSEEAAAVVNLLEREMIESHLRENQIKRTAYYFGSKGKLDEKKLAALDFEQRRRQLFGVLIAKLRGAEELRDAEGGGESGA